MVSSVRRDLEVAGIDAHRSPGPLPGHGVEQRAVDVDRECVTELVRLRLVGRLAPSTCAWEWMATESLAAQSAEDVGQGAHSKLAGCARRELEPAALAIQVARLLERARQLAQLVEVLDGIVPGQVAQGVGVDLRQPIGIAGRAKSLLHGVVLLLPVDRRQRIGQPHRRIAVERVRLAEREVRPGCLKVPGQARHVDLEAIVAQELVHHRAKLIAHLGREPVEQRRHLRRLAMQVLDQLVNAPDARREVATVLCHERREIVVDIGAGGVLLEELVQIPHHVPDPGQVLGGDALDALLQALEVRPEHLLPQLVSQVGEGGSCRVVHELVVAQSVETPRQVRWQRVEPVLTLACSSTHDLLRQAGLLLRLAGGRVECTALRVAHPLPDSLTLGLEDLLEATVHVVQHAVQVGSLELGLASGTQLLHDSSQSRHVAAPGATQATLHEPLECAAHIALGQDVVGERIEHIVRVECWQLLAAIPSGVADGAHGPCSLGRSRHAVHPQPAARSDRGEIAHDQLPVVILGNLPRRPLAPAPARPRPPAASPPT